MEPTFNSLNLPVDIVDGRLYISPEAIIELALAKHRNSLYPNEEIAKYICELLCFIMDKNHLIITQKNMKNSDMVNRFHILSFEKKTVLQ